MTSKAQTQADCRRFAYVHGIDLSGNERSGIAVCCDGYATAFDTWTEVLEVFQAWRSGGDFRTVCREQSMKQNRVSAEA